MEPMGVKPAIVVAPQVLRFVQARSSHPALNLRFQRCRRTYNKTTENGPCTQAPGLNDDAV